MKKNVIFIVLFIALFQFQSSAQNENKKRELKVYYNYNQVNYQETFNFSDGGYLWITPDITEQSSGEISFALLLKAKSVFTHELELMPFVSYKSTYSKTGKIDDATTEIFSEKGTTSLKSRFRYQMNYSIIAKDNFKTYLGLSSMLNLFNYKFDSFSSFNFPERYTKFGLIFGLTPGMEFKITDKMNLSIDVPVGIYGLNLNTIKYDSPAIPAAERNQNKFKAELWNQGFQVRLGLGLIL
jgi:hypothetical protein